MKVSIALATYNGERYLKEQLDSFLLQTRLPDELVISDDKSDDNTLNILSDFKNNAPFEVKIFSNKENIGYVKNFERAIAATTGDFIFLSDQDDVWMDNKIKIMLEYDYLHTDQPTLLTGDRILTDTNLNELGKTSIEEHVRLGFGKQGYAGGSAMVFNRQLKEIIIPIPDKFGWAHDTWITSIAKKINRYYVIDNAVQLYRRHLNSTSNSIFNSEKKYSKAKLFIESISAISDYGEHLKRQELLLERLKLLKGSEYIELVNYMKRHIEAIELRIIIRNKNLLMRLPNVIRMMIDGKYKFFNGSKSFFKDLLIR